MWWMTDSSLIHPVQDSYQLVTNSEKVRGVDTNYRIVIGIIDFHYALVLLKKHRVGEFKIRDNAFLSKNR